MSDSIKWTVQKCTQQGKIKNSITFGKTRHWPPWLKIRKVSKIYNDHLSAHCLKYKRFQTS